MSKKTLVFDFDGVIHIERLNNKLQQKENIIKEAREYIEHTYKDYKNEDGSLPLTLHDQELLEILDKENTNEETN